MKRGLYLSGGKRMFDFVLAVLCLIVFSPILLCVAVFSKFKFGSPILFVQMRPGLNAAPFQILKFRIIPF